MDETENDTELTEEERAAKRAARKAAREAIKAAGFTGTGRWLTLVSGKLTFEAKGRTDGKIQLFAVSTEGRRFVGTVEPLELESRLLKVAA